MNDYLVCMGRNAPAFRTYAEIGFKMGQDR
jgi:hypothetical protein